MSEVLFAGWGSGRARRGSRLDQWAAFAACTQRLLLAGFVSGLTAFTAAAPATVPQHPRVRGEAPSSPAPSSEPSREVLTPPVAFANLHGKSIRGTQGEKLGEVADLVVDMSVGAIPYVLVASRSAPGEGYRLRLVPTAALEPAQRGGGYMVPFQVSQWRNLESIDSAQLEAGALRAFEAHRQQLARVFGLAQAGAEPSRLYLATHLRGKYVRNDDGIIGLLVAILSKPDRRTALALIRERDQRDAATFVVPLTKLQLPAFESDHFSTSLTRDELQAAHAVKIDLTAALSVSTDVERILAASMLTQSSMRGQSAYASSPTKGTGPKAPPVPPVGPLAPAAAADEKLTPTGRTSRDVNEERIEAALAAVRQSLASDRSVPAKDIEVEVTGGQLVLRGVVPTAATRQRVEDLARKVAPSATIENRIEVRNP